MKASAFSIAVLIVIGALLFSFRNIQTGSIKGIVSPADGAVRAWAETLSDTLKADIVNGAYEITNVKPGVYRVIIEAKPPYRNAAKENVTVVDGHATDAGEIKLEK
ncbi:MAG TPA: carboxypeptidase-like regulatory domain-containing protein [Puia sp.]|nr:carboxypeptidase-like regulatory domain-containing protein [Puia sp.]